MTEEDAGAESEEAIARGWGLSTTHSSKMILGKTENGNSKGAKSGIGVRTLNSTGRPRPRCVLIHIQLPTSHRQPPIFSLNALPQGSDKDWRQAMAPLRWSVLPVILHVSSYRRRSAQCVFRGDTGQIEELCQSADSLEHRQQRGSPDEA